MTYLEICQKINTLLGMQGTFDSAESATGYQATIATIASDAWVDIQNLRKDWSFLRTSVTFSTVAGQSEYTITDIFGSSTNLIGSWIKYMILFNKAADNVIQLNNYGYDGYLVHEVSQRDQTEPSVYAIDPVDKHLYINPPDAAYSLTAHYYNKPSVLALDADIPLAPIEFHYVIVYQAAAEFAAFLGNGDLFQVYSQKASALLGDLMRAQLKGRKIRTRGIA